MRLVDDVAPEPNVRRWRRKRTALVALCWLGGLLSLYGTLLLAIAAVPRLVYVGLALGGILERRRT
jgi:hypothetical protein